ncbi:Biotin operon repressor / Biotin-protein ligase [Chitinispirillum alkaliphilum]|nr:Biotin operon repressor / Biotin-protein ligase [Chitinispirillum alkaliphilum]
MINPSLPHSVDKLPFLDKFIFFESINSTNSFAKTIKTLPDDKLLVIQSAKQTCGRGRNSKQFFSDSEGGLWVSIVAPVPDISTHFIHNRAISVAICQSIQKHCPEFPVRIKWPNDIYINGKKTAGILLESTPFSPKHIIIGFGINVNIGMNKFPPELRNIATSTLHEMKKEIAPEVMLEDILTKYNYFCSITEEQVHHLYTSHLYRIGSTVQISGICGIFETVREDGQIRIVTAQGVKHLNSGTLLFRDVNHEN